VHFANQKVDERVAEELPHQWREAKAWRQLEQNLTSLEMFETLKAHRSDEEHLGYWLSLEAVKGKQLLEERFMKSLQDQVTQAWYTKRISLESCGVFAPTPLIQIYLPQ
jgi:hypothetical protein